MEPRILCDASNEFFSTACFDGVFRRVLMDFSTSFVVEFYRQSFVIDFFSTRIFDNFYSIRESQVNCKLSYIYLIQLLRNSIIELEQSDDLQCE